jgi:hypothetical protein
MGEEVQMTPGPTPSQLRAADTDRDATAERLAAAMSDGRLQADEYGERLEQAYAATTYAELDRLVADLPAPARLSSATSPRAAKDRATTLHVADDAERSIGCHIACLIFTAVLILALLL